MGAVHLCLGEESEELFISPLCFHNHTQLTAMFFSPVFAARGVLHKINLQTSEHRNKEVEHGKFTSDKHLLSSIVGFLLCYFF